MPERRGKADMVKLALVVVETEEEGAHFAASRRVAEAPDDAIGAAQAFEFDHGALAGTVDIVAVFGDDAIEGAAGALQPTLRLGSIRRPRREAKTRGVAPSGMELLQGRTARTQGRFHQALA